jgi:hypothetical protein
MDQHSAVSKHVSRTYRHTRAKKLTNCRELLVHTHVAAGQSKVAAVIGHEEEGHAGDVKHLSSIVMVRGVFWCKVQFEFEHLVEDEAEPAQDHDWPTTAKKG